MRWPGLPSAVVLLAAGLGVFGTACSTRQKKLSDPDGSVFDNIVYGTFGMDRNTSYYYELVRDSHAADGFRYRRSADKFIVDKNVDAVQRLGQAEYARLEGEAQVVVLLVDVLLEDPAALAQANAANSLTRLGLKLPPYPSRGLEERGDRFLALLQEMDRMHAAGGAMQTSPQAAQARTAQILREIGDFEMAGIVIAKDTLKPFYTRDYLIDATDPAVRQAADTALVKRMGEVVRLALRAAVDNDTAFVREEAIRGLKTLGDRGGVDAVLGRLEVETHPRVRAEAVEYLGRVGDQAAVAALLEHLEDGDPSVAHKARQSLTRIAERDLGFRRAPWTRWAYARHPELAARAREAAVAAAKDESATPPDIAR